jgi:hypothetical protein
MLSTVPIEIRIFIFASYCLLVALIARSLMKWFGWI